MRRGVSAGRRGNADTTYYARHDGAWKARWRDSGWTAFSPASGFAGVYRYRVLGGLIEVRWACTTSIAAGAFVNPLFTLPAVARPSTDVAAAVYGAFAQPMTALLGADGVLYIRNNHSAAAANHSGSAIYLQG